MLIQVIHCHPLTDSYNHVLFQTIIAALGDKGHEVAATDLYREQFDPGDECQRAPQLLCGAVRRHHGVSAHSAAQTREWNYPLLSAGRPASPSSAT